MPTSRLSIFLTCLFLSILADPQFGGTGRVFGAAQSQGIEQLTTGGQVTSKPIVNNGRILYHTRAGFRTVSIELANVRNESGPTFLRVANDIELVFTGSPDLDEHGNVAYVAKVGDRHQVFLHDARTGASLQLTDNSELLDSPQIGLGTVDVGTGFPRVANGHVVFRDTEGNVFLYDPTLERIRQINMASDQTANMGSAIDTEKRFEFDGQHIVWLHEKVLEVIATPAGQQKRSEITVYLAAPLL